MSSLVTLKSVGYAILIVTCLSVTIRGQSCYQLDRASIKTNLESDIRQYFSDVRHPILPGYKENATDYIRSVYQTVANSNDNFEVKETAFYVQNFDGQFSTTFININGILKGRYWGTADDRILLLGAHYDTLGNTPGVDDNGSGTAALLEALKLLSGCTFPNTIMFAAFDAEEWNAMGSERFVNNYLIPTVLKDSSNNARTKFQGAYILDMIMNYQTEPNSQDISLLESLAQIVPTLQSLVDKMIQKGKTGDFITAIGRIGVEDDLYRAFSDNYSPGDDHIAYISVPPVYNLAFAPLLRSDHAFFWLSSFSGTLPAGQSHLPALFLTDTAENRHQCDAGGCSASCYHRACDSVDNINEQNVDFMAATTEALVQALHQLAMHGDGGNPPGETTSDPPGATTPDPPGATTPDLPGTTTSHPPSVTTSKGKSKAKA